MTDPIDPSETGPLDAAENDPALPAPLRDLAKSRRERHFAMWSVVHQLDHALKGTEVHRAFERTMRAWATPAFNALQVVLAERGPQRSALNDPSSAVEANLESKAESAAVQALQMSLDEMRGRCEALALVLQAIKSS